ncbi:MAG: ATP-binding protein [Trueperaceae bacterium]
MDRENHDDGAPRKWAFAAVDREHVVVGRARWTAEGTDADHHLRGPDGHEKLPAAPSFPTWSTMTCEELLLLRESVDLEVKRAQGRHGGGAVPESIWETYSAMANTSGGVIVLGAGERDDGSLSIVGIDKPAKVLRDLWNTLNNTSKVSRNVLHHRDVEVMECGDQQVITISVPRASRSDRPIYLGENPFSGTYRRHNEGDYRCDEMTVRRMIADATHETRDDFVLEGFDLHDLDANTLSAFRNEFRSTRPGHPWIALDDKDLLEQLGGWKRDRRSELEGVTAAGLLMFGQLRPLLEAFPTYQVDYQQRPDKEDDPDRRWVDRVTTDGTWPGNLYDFYRRVFPRLTSDLRIPFQLKDGHKRVDETRVHEALREALVNTLIHADFLGTTAISILKFPHKFVFRNPGGLRLPLDVVRSGGTSDCRNRNLQKMFQMVGAGEQAGSGIPKILRAWREQEWHRPAWREYMQPDRTHLEMEMHTLLPPESLGALSFRFGKDFEHLNNHVRLAVVIAHTEGSVTNQRLQEITDTHPTDLTRSLRQLVEDGMLVKDGVGRGSSYELPPFDGQPSSFEMDRNDGRTKQPDPENLQAIEETTTAKVETEQPIYPPEVIRVRNSGRVTERSTMEAAILAACNDTFLTASELATILRRSTQTLRATYLPPLVSTGDLLLLHANKRNHPRQAYKARQRQYDSNVD